MSPTKTKNPALRYALLGRDGVLNRRLAGHTVASWDEFEFLPYALDGLRLLTARGYASVVIANQANAAKGTAAANSVDLLTRRMLLETALCGAMIAQVSYCRHRVEDHCTCRMPLPGLIVKARLEHGFTPEDTFFVSDDSDEIAAATAAGCRPIRIQRDSFLRKRRVNEDAELSASNLYEAARMIADLGDALHRFAEIEKAMHAGAFKH